MKVENEKMKELEEEVSQLENSVNVYEQQLEEYLNEERTGIRLLFMKEMDDRIGGIMEKEGNHHE